MASLSNTNNVDILIKTTSDNSGLQATQQELGKLDQATSNSSKVGQFFNENLGKGAVVAGVVVGALGALTKSALDQASSYQQNRVAFETMLGSADKAKTLLKQVSDFAAQTPFELPQVVEGSKHLLAFGVSMNDIIPTFTMLGNIAAGVGTDKLPGLINVFGQVKAAGRLMSQDLLQFTSAGVPVIDLLAQHYGITSDKVKHLVETGKVGFGDLQSSLQLLGGPTGKWGDLMAKQSLTFNGTLSNVSDQMGRILRQAIGIGPDGDIRKGSLFEVATKGATALLNGLSAAAPYIEKFTNLMEHNKLVMALVGGALVGLVALIVGGLVAALWAAVAVAGTFALVAAAVAAVAFIVISHWSQIRGFFTGLWGHITGMATAAWNAITGGLDYLYHHFFEIVGFMIGFFATLPIKLPIFFIEAIIAIIRWFAGVNWGAVFSSIGHAFVGVMNWVKDAFLGAYHFLTGLNWGGILSGIGKGVANAIIGLIEGGINGALSGIPGHPKVKLPRFAKGVRNFQGGLAIVGEEGPELVNLPAGSDVIPNNRISNTSTVTIGQVVLSSAAAVDRFFDKIDQDTVNLGKGLTPTRGAY